VILPSNRLKYLGPLRPFFWGTLATLSLSVSGYFLVYLWGYLWRTPNPVRLQEQAQAAEGILEDRAEVKLRLSPEADAAKILQTLGLREGGARVRGYAVFDTPERLFGSRDIQLRSLVDFEKSNFESTVKIREIRRNDLSPRFRGLPEVKCETNVTPSSEVPSCSLSIEGVLTDADRSLFTPLNAATYGRLRVRSGGFISRTFSALQEEFLEVQTGMEIWRERPDLAARQFAHVSKWKVPPGTLGLDGGISPGEEVVLERSVFVVEPGIPPTPAVHELSWKVPYSQRLKVMEQFRAWAERKGLPYELNPPPRVSRL
jgi:hypothetical protein